MLRREISLKVICEKSNVQTVIFVIIVLTMNGHTYKLFNDFLTEGLGEIIMY